MKGTPYKLPPPENRVVFLLLVMTKLFQYAAPYMEDKLL